MVLQAQESTLGASCYPPSSSGGGGRGEGGEGEVDLMVNLEADQGLRNASAVAHECAYVPAQDQGK